jgi:sec-independent protein translocase protein TatB
MFDIGWGEFVVVGVVALVVIGPKELPGVLRTVGRTVGKVKRLAGEFQGQFQDAMREMELDEARKTVEGLNTEVSTTLNTGFNPIQTIRDEIKGATETPATGAAALPETTIDIPEPPPVPDLTPEQIQAAFAPVSPIGGDVEADQAQETPAKPKRPRKKAVEAPAADEASATLFPLATAPVAPEAVAESIEDAPKPRRASRSRAAAAEAGPAEGEGVSAPKRRAARKTAAAEKPTTEDEGSAG